MTINSEDLSSQTLVGYGESLFRFSEVWQGSMMGHVPNKEVVSMTVLESGFNTN
jgi:hypothetical protein